MPFLLALFWVMGRRAGVLDRRGWLWSVAGFVAAVAPMVLWLLWHPEAFHSLRLQYNRADPGSATLLEMLAQGGVAAAVREFVRIYWSYFDPSFLFVQGGNARTTSTGEVGVFLIPVAFLALWGFRALRAHPTARLLLTVLVLTAPLPAVVKGAPYAIQRASGLLLFVSLLAGFGLAALWRSERRAVRALAAILGVVTLWQFAGFHRDYHGNYRVRSGHAYDATAFRDAADVIIDEDRRATLPAVYIPAGFYDASAKWRFYTTKHDRLSLWRKTEYYAGGPAALGAAPPGALAVVPAVAGAHAGIDGWIEVRALTTLMGDATVSVLRRDSR
jgi:hypothetical protein